ncbi:MAG: hypothetical protein RQ741_02245 [Wenzhouxiangellaceae bacterium]|nr:hypothetical protein [Wenzhouxiangellaceae bacterium]
MNNLDDSPALTRWGSRRPFSEFLSRWRQHAWEKLAIASFLLDPGGQWLSLPESVGRGLRAEPVTEHE